MYGCPAIKYTKRYSYIVNQIIVNTFDSSYADDAAYVYSIRPE